MPDSNSTVNNKGFLSELLPMWVAIFGLVFATGSLVAQEAESSEDSKKVVEADEDEEDSKEDASANSDEALEEEVVSDDEDEDSPKSQSLYADEDMEEVITTGTYMPISDPTALIVRYTAADIEEMGVTDLSDFFRRVPEQFNSTTPQTSTSWSTGDELGGDSGGIYYAQNLATVNLHGMGSGNTLVLLDGRRVAGFGGSERDIVNILGIPLEAIAAVEIQLDGGSAVYGADALGGVVNFITKKNYRGISLNMKQDNSYTGADDYTTGMTFGFNWAKFRTTVSIETGEREPIINAKTGHKTLDFRHLFGPEYDYRNFDYAQPGIVREWNGSSRYPGPYYSDWYINGSFTIDWEKRNFIAQLPPDHTGLNSTPEDFNYGRENIHPYNRIEPVNGAHSSRDGMVMNVYYDLNDNVEIFMNSRYSTDTSFQEMWSIYSLAMRLVVPATNAYNPFGRPMHVTYVPGNEQDTGILPIPFRKVEGENKNVTLGVKWKLIGENELEFSVTEGRSSNLLLRFQSSTRRERYAPGTDEFYRRLASPDPDEAFNLFGNGTVGGAPFRDFLGNTSRQIGTNRVTEIAVLAKGFWFELNGERISYSLRYSQRALRYTNRYQYLAGLYVYDFDYNAIWNGFSEPVSRSNNFSFEFWLPIFSHEEPKLWGKEMQFTIKNTRTGNFNWGVVSGFDFQFETTEGWVWNPSTLEWETVPVNQWEYGIDRAEAEFIKFEEYDNAPSFGLYYEPLRDLTVTINYSKNVEPPLTSQLYDSLEGSDWWVNDVVDPCHRDADTPEGEYEEVFYDRVPYRYSWANPNLKSTKSVNWSLRMVWKPQFFQNFEGTFTFADRSVRDKVDRGINYRTEPRALCYDVIASRTPEGVLEFINYDYFNAYQDKTVTAGAIIKYRLQFESIGLVETTLQYNAYIERKREPLKGLVFSALGTARDPDKYTGSVGVFWSKGSASANLSFDYTPGYLNDRAHYCSYLQIINEVGQCYELYGPWGANGVYRSGYLQMEVGSLTTVYFSGAYRFSPEFSVRFSAQNLLNRSAPLTIRDRKPYDATRWDARGRVLSMSFNYTPSFY
ncbi:MAG: TonB-dependent receptor plug domain-containing protein [Gammaproteobacteria bacterium]|nr:TonB-dependent receptor plug domain-containing protein [Gammaproteobacteria bacterium]MYC25154.1 TonB-dependent receptor plug domain-containing protein [Gammaproteobacteria bacterium]